MTTEATSVADIPTEAPQPGLGEAVSTENATVTVDSAYLARSIDMFTEQARDDGIFVVVETTVRNDGAGDMDLTCAHTGSWVNAVLETDSEARYQPLPELYQIPGNPGCNQNLGSGFDTPMTWLFLIPEISDPMAFGFSHSDDHGDDLSWIVLGDVEEGELGFEDVEAQPPLPTEREEVVEEPSPMPAVQQPSAPVYGASCSESQSLQPAIGADGSNLVCVFMGGDSGFSWVYGPAPQGVGTAEPGGACGADAQGAQDYAGRMMMCMDGQWIYGP